MLILCCQPRIVDEAVYVRIYFLGSQVREREADVRCISKSSLKLKFLPPPFALLLLLCLKISLSVPSHTRSYSGLAYACRKYPLHINQYMAIAGWDVFRAMASLIRQ